MIEHQIGCDTSANGLMKANLNTGRSKGNRLRGGRAIAYNALTALFLGLAILPAMQPVAAQTDFDINAESADLKSEFQKELDKWMLRAYEGDRDAQFKVGVLFANDQFGPPDNEQASYWYTQAARQGHVLAQYNLGHQYLTGTGVKRDENSAMRWWLKAAAQQHSLAQFNVGRAYYLGIGLEKDLQQAKLWFERASQNNEPKSTEILKQLGWWNQESIANVAQPSPTEATDATASTAFADASKSKQQTTHSAHDVIAGSPPLSDTSNTGVDVQSNRADKATQPATGTETLPTAVTPQDDGQSNKLKPDSPFNSSIAVFTNPAIRSVLITIIDNADDLELVSEDAPWSVVNSNNGLPVWVSKNFIAKDRNQGTVTGSSVNARSVPLVTSGSVVGRLNRGERVEILDERKDWYRVMSPKRFRGWVKTSDLLTSLGKPAEVEQRSISDEPNTQTQEQNALNAFANKIDNNKWLFGQDKAHYALQLASFSSPESTKRFMESLPFKDSADLRLFTTTSNEGVKWTYILYGNYEDDNLAKNARLELKQKRAWVRRFGVLQQKRCISWKKELPAPKELNEYCI